jgi:hypothetical protein
MEAQMITSNETNLANKVYVVIEGQYEDLDIWGIFDSLEQVNIELDKAAEKHIQGLGELYTYEGNGNYRIITRDEMYRNFMGQFRIYESTLNSIHDVNWIDALGDKYLATDDSGGVARLGIWYPR